jgi:hypothetical protein
LFSVFQLRNEILFLAGFQIRQKFMSFFFADTAPSEFRNEYGIEVFQCWSRREYRVRSLR